MVVKTEAASTATLSLEQRNIGPDVLAQLVESRLATMLSMQLLPVTLVENDDHLGRFVCGVKPDPLTIRIPWHHLDGRTPVFTDHDEREYVLCLILGARCSFRIEQWSVDDLGVVAWLCFEDEVGRRPSKQGIPR